MVKNVVLVAIFCCLFLTEDYGQAVLDRKVSLDLNEVTFKRVLKEIEKQARVKFVYSRDHVDMTGSVTISVSEMPLRQVFEKLLPKRKAKCVFEEDDYIILVPRKDNELSLPLTKISVQMKEQLPTIAPLVTVKGKVESSEEEVALPGVSVVVKGTIRATVTDATGNYLIQASDADTLVYSFVGYNTRVESVAGIPGVIKLDAKVTRLDEVVVIAYGTSLRRTMTGSVSRIRSEDIQKQSVSNPLQTLQGRMTGVLINQANGLPGTAINVQIRGKSSISNGNDPLYVVDGVPFISQTLASPYVGSPYLEGTSPLSSINPGVIESIEVLKDASATAIYGSRAANGVVLITTKKGKPGESKVDFNIYSGIGKVTNNIDLLNTQQYLEMRREAFKNDGAIPLPWDYDLTQWDTTRYTDWQKELIGGMSNINNMQASISGGDVNTQFFCSGGLYEETTVFPGDFLYLKGSTHFNMKHKMLNDRLNANLTVSYSSEKNDLTQIDLTPYAIGLAPNAPSIFDESGNLNWANSTWTNPYSYLEGQYNSKTDNLMMSGIITIDITKAFRLKTNAGFTRMYMNETSINPTTMVDPDFAPPSGTSRFADSYVKTWIIEPQAEYEKKLGKGKLSVLAGATLQRNIQSTQTLLATGFVNNHSLRNIHAATSITALDVSDIQYRYAATFGRISYNYDGKYVVDITGRRDGSSRFSPSKRFAKFGAIGTAWIFSNEFVDKARFVSFGKLRASYGITGNDQIEDYLYYQIYKPTAPYQGGVGLVPTNFPNNDYSWETNKKFETAVELGFFKDKLLLTIGKYLHRSSNQLLMMPLPSFTGQSSVHSNLEATVQNTGWEFELSTSSIQKELTWITFANLTIPNNKLLEYQNLAGSSYANRYVVGAPLGIQNKIHNMGVNAQTGIYEFEDIDGNGSGTDDPGDRQPRKIIGVEFYGGLQNTISYKGFELSIFIQYVKQSGFNYQFFIEAPPGFKNTNQPIEVLDRWQKSGDNKSIQRFTQKFASDAYFAYTQSSNSDYTIQDASFVRLKSVSLSYKFPYQWFRTKNFRIYMQSQNLLTITDYAGIDPETQQKVLPPLKVLTGGLQFTF